MRGSTSFHWVTPLRRLATKTSDRFNTTRSRTGRSGRSTIVEITPNKGSRLQAIQRLKHLPVISERPLNLFRPHQLVRRHRGQFRERIRHYCRIDLALYIQVQFSQPMCAFSPSLPGAAPPEVQTFRPPAAQNAGAQSACTWCVSWAVTLADPFRGATLGEEKDTIREYRPHFCDRSMAELRSLAGFRQLRLQDL